MRSTRSVLKRLALAPQSTRVQRALGKQVKTGPASFLSTRSTLFVQRPQVLTCMFARPFSAFGDSSVLSEAEFHDLSEHFLEDTLTSLEEVVDYLEDERGSDCDLEYSQGVLSLDVDGASWVINKQAANKQIWMSSPYCGPKRFNYDAPSRDWVETRDGGALRLIIKKDMDELFGGEDVEQVVKPGLFSGGADSA